MLAAVLEISCSRSSNPSSKIERLSILRFDNLTGDPSFDWLTTAAPGMLIDQLTGSGQILPSLADSVSGAYIEQATRMGHGYFEKRAGKLHFAVLIEDSENHKIVQRDTADGPPLAAMGALAKQLDPRARAFSTSNPEAAAAWGRGEFEQAAGLDPDFGLAWLAWAQKLAAGGDSGRAEEVAQRALMRPGLRSVIERTRLELLLSSLRGDAQGRVHALQELARLIPADPSNLRALAEAEMNARNFSEAAREYRELIQSGTGAADAGLENALGYAEAFAGNLEAAKKAFAEYGREPGQAVNALDSLGEGLFVNGKFAEAEKAFLEAYSKDSSFLDGVDLWKAAYARWLGGDLKGADGLMGRYFEARSKAADPLLVWRKANWLYATGRREQAVALLMQAPSAAAEVARKQLTVWRDPNSSLPHGLADLKKLYSRTDPSKDGLVRTLYAAALLDAGQKSEARKLIALWPLPDNGDSLFQALLYPKYLDLRKMLL